METLEQVRTDVLTENTAQTICKYLEDLEHNRAAVRSRWVWELLQNARDTATGTASIEVSFTIDEEYLVFRHNGSGFAPREITHLIYHGTTKLDSKGPLGHFGSGFLTSHLISRQVEIVGRLDDGRPFRFVLDRRGSKADELSEAMERSWRAFTDCIENETANTDGDEFTEFRYSIHKHSADVVHEGLLKLKACAPYLIAFNPELRKLSVVSQGEEQAWTLARSEKLADGLFEISVEWTQDAGRSDPKTATLLVSRNENVSVSMPVVDTLGNRTFAEPEVPRLFLGFPLSGTETFAFPAVVNCFDFVPTEERDGVYFGRAEDEANLGNERALGRAAEALVSLGAYGALSGWSGLSMIARTRRVQDRSWLDEESYRRFLREKLQKPLASVPIVICQDGRVRSPAEASIPVAANVADAARLWSAADGILDLSPKLCRRQEAAGWCETLHGWVELTECAIKHVEGALDQSVLVQLVEAASNLDGLNAVLQDDLEPIVWLNEFHELLLSTDASVLLDTATLVPDQRGTFRLLAHLHSDGGIQEILKEAGDLLGVDIRGGLRDARLTTLARERPDPVKNEADVLSGLLDALKEAADDGRDRFADASIKLFAWLVESERWAQLRGFPALSADSDPGGGALPRYLPGSVRAESDLPLAPVAAWPEGARGFVELFHSRNVLSGRHAESLQKEDSWQSLEREGLLWTSPLIRVTRQLDRFYPELPEVENRNEAQEHVTAERICVTEIAYFNAKDIGVLDRVRRNPARACTLWRFLASWVVGADPNALGMRTVECECGESHETYAAVWLVSLATRQWVPLGPKQSARASASSLGQLFRKQPDCQEWIQSEGGRRLLRALGIRLSELTMELLAEDEESRQRLEQSMSEMLEAVGGNEAAIQEVVAEIRDDPAFFRHLEERRAQRDRVHENQRVGSLVEAAVREAMKAAGFTVERTGVGSDFEVEYDLIDNDGREVGIRLTSKVGRWLVEVKATRGNDARMTPAQAETAIRERDRFLLCVVPIEGDVQSLSVNAVAESMRFVTGMYRRVEALVVEMHELAEHVAIARGETREGVTLEVESGSTRFRVESTVWSDGIRLSALAQTLGGAEAHPE